jgi:hypothetical protein
MPKEDKHFWDETRKPWLDLEGEQRVVRPYNKKPHKSSRATELTGVTNKMMAGFFQDLVLDEAVKDFEALHCDQPHSDLNPGIEACCPSLNGEASHSEDIDDLDFIRQKRMDELKNQSKNINALKSRGHGEYKVIEETDFLPCVTSSDKVVVHFFHRDFKRCSIIDKHLDMMAKSIITCRFVKLEASKATFFVSKLSVKVLPTVVFFVNGVAVGRMVGFEGIKDEENCSTIDIVDAMREAKFLSETDCKDFDTTQATIDNVASEHSDEDFFDE